MAGGGRKRTEEVSVVGQMSRDVVCEEIYDDKVVAEDKEGRERGGREIGVFLVTIGYLQNIEADDGMPE